VSIDDSAWYIEVPLEIDEDTMADAAVDYLQAQWTDWEPNDADLEVVQIEALSGMAGALAQQASVATEAIFRTFGEVLVGIPFQEGTPATTTVTFTLIDGNSYLIEDDTEVEIDGEAFLTVGDVNNVVGSTTIANVPVECATIGVEGNGLGTSVSKISSMAFVTDVVADHPTSGGSDAMTDQEYLGYVSRKLQLRADTLVTKSDHELWALDYPGVGRAYAINTADRRVTVYVADDFGEPLSAAIKTAMTTAVLNYRLVNTITTFADPTYTTVTVTYTVTALRGYDLADLKLRINSMLTGWLSPTGFGAPKFGDPGTGTSAWVGTNMVRRNSVIDRIGDVEGVDYINSVTLAPAPDGNGDVTMAGTIALPRSGAHVGPVNPPR
jgi:hypothetical protein